MRTPAICTIFLLAACLAQAQVPEGAYSITAAQFGNKTRSKEEIAKERIVKVFRNGYWIVAYYGNPEQPFNGSAGGTYTAKDGKYIETVHFYSWDSTAVGKTFTFDYTHTPTQYTQTGYMNSDKYQNLYIREDYEKIKANTPLKNSALEGVWQITEGKWASGNLGKGIYTGMTGIKIYSYPTLIFGYYKPGTGQFVAAGGGTYQFDGSKLVETLAYFSPEPSFKPAVFEYTVTLQGTNGYHQENEGKSTVETWTRATHLKP